MAQINGTSGNDTFVVGTPPAAGEYVVGDELLGGEGDDVRQAGVRDRLIGVFAVFAWGRLRAR